MSDKSKLAELDTWQNTDRGHHTVVLPQHRLYSQGGTEPRNSSDGRVDPIAALGRCFSREVPRRPEPVHVFWTRLWEATTCCGVE